METLEERFSDALGKWKEHCRSKSHFSFAQPYLDSDAYREIGSMGPKVLPLIRQAYATESEDIGNPGQFWAYAIHEIVGDDFRIEVKEDSPVKPVAQGFVGIDVRGVKQFTLKWLDENMSKYLQR
mgnify:CR=1 FL=1